MQERETSREYLNNNESRLIKLAIIASILPPWIVSVATISYLSANLQLGTLKLELDSNLIGVTGENYQGWSCHIGLHPNSTTHDLHLYCQNGNAYTGNTLGNSYYETIIPLP